MFSENTKKQYWEKKLEGINSIYINDTVKGIVQDAVNEIKFSNDKIYENLFTSKKPMYNFFYCRYLALYLNDELLYKKIKSVDVPKYILEYFMQSNSLATSDDLDWCKESPPFKYIFEGKLCPIPKNNEEALQAIKEIQEVLKLSFIEEMMERDPNQLHLNLLKFPQDLGINIKEKFSQDVNKIKEYKNELNKPLDQDSLSNLEKIIINFPKELKGKVIQELVKQGFEFKEVLQNEQLEEAKIEEPSILSNLAVQSSNSNSPSSDTSSPKAGKLSISKSKSIG